MWATIYLFLPIHPSILMLSYLLQYMVRIIFKKIQLFLFWNGSVITPTQGKCSQTNAFSNVHSLHDTSTVSLVETHVRLADPESYFCLSPFVLCHHETDVPGLLSVGSQCQTMEEAQQTPEHRSPVASRALSPSVPRGGKSRCQATRGLPRCPLAGRTMQSKTLRSWHWKHLQFFQHQWKHGSSAAWRAGDAELAQPQHCQWKMPVLGCHSGPLTLCAGVSRLGVCDFHKPLDSPSAQKDFWTLSLRALKEQEHHPHPQDRIKWQCVVRWHSRRGPTLANGGPGDQSSEKHTPLPPSDRWRCSERDPGPLHRQAACWAEAPPENWGVTCRHRLQSRRDRPAVLTARLQLWPLHLFPRTPRSPPLHLFQQRRQAPPAARDRVCSFQAPKTGLSFRAGTSEGIQLGSRYYEQLRDHILKSRHTKLKKERQQLWPFLGRPSRQVTLWPPGLFPVKIIPEISLQSWACLLTKLNFRSSERLLLSNISFFI